MDKLYLASLLRDIEGLEEEFGISTIAELKKFLGDELEKKTLVIMPNNTGANCRCAICGKRTQPRIPYEIFLCDTFDEVCSECAKKYDTALAEMLEFYYTKSEAEHAEGEG